MRVDGSSTPVAFVLSPPTNVSYGITQIVLTVHSTGMDLATASELRTFGASGALSTGITIFESRGAPAVNVQLLPTPLKTVAGVFRSSQWGPSGGPFVIGHTDAIAAGTDSLSFVINTGPITLRKNTADLLTVLISDDLTGLALFEAHAIGVQYL